MCGIFGYVGGKQGVKIALEGLKKLEYRGYDSAGLAAVVNKELVTCKSVGKVAALEQKIEPFDAPLVMAHTRWATHGGVTEENAHPQWDEKRTLAVLLNGIIENFQSLKELLQQEGVYFVSETDTEVIPHLIARAYEGDFLKAVQEAVTLLKGSYAISCIHKDHPDEIVVAANGSPLILGVGIEETFVSSDPNALLCHTRQVIYLSHGETASVKAKRVEVFDATKTEVSKKIEALSHDAEAITKGAFEHYTLKEIFEQPQSIKNAMLLRFFEDFGTVSFENFTLPAHKLLEIKRVLIVACGTSYHAALLGGYMLEDRARLPTQVEISSEFRYKNPVISDDTFVIVISQSGETADTIAAMRELKAKGAYVLGLCNVQGSTIAREVDSCLFLRAGPEIGVCSTKAFTSQLTVLSLFALFMARMRHMSKIEGQQFLHAMLALPLQIEEILKQADKIEEMAERYSRYDHFFFVGRRYMFPTALEGALKLKEISYINANGYAAGELKHGPIALIEPDCPTVALLSDKVTFEKTLSNLMEIKARHGKIIAVTDKVEPLKGVADEIFELPSTYDELAPILSSVFCQLFSYYVAKKRGAEIDKPRNLAKSVTVE